MSTDNNITYTEYLKMKVKSAERTIKHSGDIIANLEEEVDALRDTVEKLLQYKVETDKKNDNTIRDLEHKVHALESCNYVIKTKLEWYLEDVEDLTNELEVKNNRIKELEDMLKERL